MNKNAFENTKKTKTIDKQFKVMVGHQYVNYSNSKARKKTNL